MKRLFFLIILYFFFPFAAKAATEFVNVVDPGNGTGTDYTSLSAWENSFGTIDLTFNTLVFSGTTTSTLSDSVTVYQCRSGVYQSVTGTMTHDTATQALVKSITAGATFSANDRWYTNNTCDSANYFTISNIGDSPIVVAKCRTTTGAADTAAVTIDGFTTSATNYIKVWTDPNENYRHKGKWDEGKYRLEITNSNGILINEDYATVDGLQILLTGTDNSYNGSIRVGTLSVTNNSIKISNNILKGNISGAGEAKEGIWINYDGNAITSIWNNIVYGFIGTDSKGVENNSQAEAYIYNNTILNNLTGIVASQGTVIAKNNLAYNNAADYSGSFNASSSNNLSKDGSSPNTGSTDCGSHYCTNQTVAFISTTSGNDDFHLAASDSGARNAGTDLHADPNLPFSTDIDGNSRPSQDVWDIGADEWSGATYQSSEAGQMTNGLVGYWSFNEQDIHGNTAYDRSTSGNNGAISGAQKAIGKRGQALNFDGDDYVNLGQPSTLDITGSFTVSAYIKADSFPQINNDIVSKYSGSWTFNISKDYADPRLLFYFTGDSETHTGGRYSNTIVNANTWYYLTGVYNSDSDTVDVYINGMLDNGILDGVIPDTIDVYPIDTYIGARPSEPNDNFHGLIDEVRIYDRALSADEVKSLYNLGEVKMNSSQNSGTSSGLVGLWSFNGADLHGNTAYDRSGQGNDGTISGASRTIGKIGQALSFDGADDYIEIQDNSNFDISNALTLSAFIKTPLPVDTANTILAKGGLGGSLYGLSIEGANSQICFYTTGTTSPNCSGSPVYANSYCNNWCLITAVFDGSTKKIYVDGIERSSIDVSGTIDTNNNNLRIGMDTIGGYEYTGVIDEVRVYSRALSADEVKDLYNAGVVKVLK